MVNRTSKPLQLLYQRLAEASQRARLKAENKNMQKFKVTTRLTPNFTPLKVNRKLGVVLHHTGGSAPGCVEWMANPQAKAGCHVVILRNGDRVVMAGDDVCTWHAGQSEWRGMQWCNNFTLGVEFEGDTNQKPLTAEQIESFIEWYLPKAKLYNWTAKDITDHRTISPGRKVDLRLTEYQRIIAEVNARPDARTT